MLQLLCGCATPLRAVVITAMNVDAQPLFQRRRHLPTSPTYDRLPGYMKPTIGSTQKSWLNRSRTSPQFSSVMSRPQSSPVTLSYSLNLNQVRLTRPISTARAIHRKIETAESSYIKI